MARPERLRPDWLLAGCCVLRDLTRGHPPLAIREALGARARKLQGDTEKYPLPRPDLDRFGVHRFPGETTPTTLHHQDDPQKDSVGHPPGLGRVVAADRVVAPEGAFALPPDLRAAEASRVRALALLLQGLPSVARGVP